MKASYLRVAAALMAIGVSIQFAPAQQPGIARSEVQRRSVADLHREVIQVVVDFEPGSAFGNHSHPGEEIAFVLQGSLEYRLEGQPPITLKAGESLFVPAGVAHAARNVGKGRASELATYIVRSEEPLVKLVP